jgi:2-(1,2-epoxy-1,2-dihydrophenyl)acetyl-CoA isomerase
MQSYETIEYREDAGVATLTLNRPQKRNAIDLVMRRELNDVIAHVGGNADVKTVILTGKGDHFCSGGDVSTMKSAQLSAEDGRTRVAPVIAFSRSLLELQKPVIAAVDGSAYGAGFSLCLCADLVVATPRTRFCMSFLRVGLVPDLASAFTLPRIVGWQRAKQLMYSMGEIDGAQALEYGIVSELAEPEALQGRCADIARAMTGMPAAAFAMTKQALLRTFSTDLAAMADGEGYMQGIAFNTEYHREAAGLLLDKKPMRYVFPKAGG